MYHLHHLNHSRSQRIVWLLEHLGADYQIHVHKRDRKTNLAPKALSQIHPLGRAPVLVHNDKVIAESGAICEYIALQFPDSTVFPAQADSDYIDVQFWSHYAEGSFMAPLVTNMVLDKARSKAKPFFVKYIANKLIDGIMAAYFGPNIAQNFAFVEAHLSDKEWLVGDKLSLADFQMSFGLEAIYKAGRLNDYPAMRAYVERIHALPVYQRAMQKMQEAENA